MREAPQRAHGHGWLGMHLAHHRRPAEALGAFERAAALDPDEPRYLLGYGVALLSVGDQPHALAVAEHGLRQFQPATDFQMLAAASLLQSRPEQAREHLLRCLAANPRHQVCAGMLASLPGQR